MIHKYVGSSRPLPFSFVWLLILIIILSGSGCLKLGPDYKRPDLKDQLKPAYQHGPQESEGPITTDRWWQTFGRPEIESLVDEVLNNNLDMQKAAARIQEVRAQFVSTRADRFPSLAIQGQASRQKLPKTGFMSSLPAGTMSSEIDAFTLSLPAVFELDLWGLYARLTEAARADLLGAEENLRTIAQGLIAEAIVLFFQVEAYERQIHITQNSLESLEKSLALVESRYKRGLTNILDLRQARRSLARSKASLPLLRQDLYRTQQRLAILSGRYPESRPPRTPPKDYFKQLAPVPPGIPSDLLLRRPDMRAAEARLRALNARVGAAKAGRFPRIRLTGNFGYSSEELNRLIVPESELWQIAADLSQPLFNAGRLKASQRGAEARYEQGLAEYKKAALAAFAEVEGALVARKELLKRRELVLSFLEESRATQQIAESRYMKGLADYLTVLEAQQTWFSAEQDLALVELAILTNRVTLHRVLGGGWEGPEADKE